MHDTWQYGYCHVAKTEFCPEACEVVLENGENVHQGVILGVECDSDNEEKQKCMPRGIMAGVTWQKMNFVQNRDLTCDLGRILSVGHNSDTKENMHAAATWQDGQCNVATAFLHGNYVI